MSSMLDSLMGGAGAGGPAPAPMGPSGPAPVPGGDTQGGGGTPGQPDSPDAEQALSDAIDALTQFMAVEEDDQDKAVAAKALATLQSIFGGRQKQDEAASGITPAHKAMGRAMKSQGAGGYGG